MTHAVPPTIKDKPKVTKDEKKKTVLVECVVQSDSLPKVKVMKGSETIFEDRKHMAKVEQIKDGEYSVKFQINEPTKADEGNYKFVIQSESGETTSASVEVKDVPLEKGKLIFLGMRQLSLLKCS